jgi:uncharacterized protein YndB with AHSA1/START domain
MSAVAGPWPGTALELSRFFDAPVGRVFEAFTDVALLRQWWGPRDFEIEEIDFRPVVGESYRVALRAPDGSRYEHVGTFSAVEPPSRLVYSWRWTEGPLQREQMQVELSFLAEGEGTRVDLRQSRFVDAASRDAHAGWPQSFERLAAWLAASIE